MKTKEAAQHLGRIGGKVRSSKKTIAARKNAKKGGWPKGKKRPSVGSDEWMTDKEVLKDARFFECGLLKN